MSARNVLLIDVAIIFALILLGVAGYRASSLLAPEDHLKLPLSACDLQKTACNAALPGGGSVRLELVPRPVRVVEPMEVRVDLEGVAANRVEIDFAGVGMNMGLNRQPLEKIAPGRFAGRANLPVCITGSMTWEATVLIEVGRMRAAVPFRFDVGH